MAYTIDKGLFIIGQTEKRADKVILSRKSRYGLRALIDLGKNAGDGRISLSSIAERNQISSQYLEQIFASLRRAGIIQSVKGSQGGYYLAKEPSEITVSEILHALDGSFHIEPEKSEDDGIAQTVQSCVIDRLNQAFDEILEEETLGDLISYYNAHHVNADDMYYI